KIFMTASAEIRAQRRFLELREKGMDVSFEQVLRNVEERDQLDTTRDDSPLVIAKDAVVIDNSNLTKDQQFDKISALAQELIIKQNQEFPQNEFKTKIINHELSTIRCVGSLFNLNGKLFSVNWSSATYRTFLRHARNCFYSDACGNGYCCR